MLFSYSGSFFPGTLISFNATLHVPGLFSLWTFCRWLLQYPATQIWSFHLIQHLELRRGFTPSKNNFFLLQELQSSWWTWHPVLYFTIWTSCRCLSCSWISCFPDIYTEVKHLTSLFCSSPLWVFFQQISSCKHLINGCLYVIHLSPQDFYFVSLLIVVYMLIRFFLPNVQTFLMNNNLQTLWLTLPAQSLLRM